MTVRRRKTSILILSLLLVAFSVAATIVWWAIRVTFGIFLAVFGALLLAFLFTR